MPNVLFDVNRFIAQSSSGAPDGPHCYCLLLLWSCWRGNIGIKWSFVVPSCMEPTIGDDTDDDSG
jgi:hypothetical protein